MLILLFIYPLRVLYTYMSADIKNFKNLLFLIEMFYPAVPMSLFEAQSLRAKHSSIKRLHLIHLLTLFHTVRHSGGFQVFSFSTSYRQIMFQKCCTPSSAVGGCPE